MDLITLKKEGLPLIFDALNEVHKEQKHEEGGEGRSPLIVKDS